MGAVVAPCNVMGAVVTPCNAMDTVVTSCNAMDTVVTSCNVMGAFVVLYNTIGAVVAPFKTLDAIYNLMKLLHFWRTLTPSFPANTTTVYNKYNNSIYISMTPELRHQELGLTCPVMNFDFLYVLPSFLEPSPYEDRRPGLKEAARSA